MQINQNQLASDEVRIIADILETEALANVPHPTDLKTKEFNAYLLSTSELIINRLGPFVYINQGGIYYE